MDRSLAAQKKALQRLTLAQTAFTQAAALCDHMRAIEVLSGSDLAAAMMTGVIVTYTKPFKRSDGIGPLPPEFHEFPSDSPLGHLHQTALDARNYVYAHRDYKNSPTIAGPAFSGEVAHLVTLTLKEHGHDVLVFEPQIAAAEAAKFQVLCNYQHARATESVRKLVASLKSRHGLTLGAYEIGDAIRLVS